MGIVKKIGDQVGFYVLPLRRDVERFFAWINRNQRLAKGFEETIVLAETFDYAVCIILFTRRLALSMSFEDSDIAAVWHKRLHIFAIDWH